MKRAQGRGARRERAWERDEFEIEAGSIEAGSSEEGDVFHRVVFAVSRPQLGVVHHRAGGDQRIRDLNSMAPTILLEVNARLMSRFFVDGCTCQRPKQVVQSVMLVEPRAGPQLVAMTYRSVAEAERPPERRGASIERSIITPFR